MPDITHSSEQWLPVVGYEGHYEVSDAGRVRSIDRTVPHPASGSLRLKGRLLGQKVSNGMHLKVTLSAGGVLANAYIHTLVLAAFVGPPPPGMECLHGRSGPCDNSLTNLRYGTRSENHREKRLDGTDYNVNKTHCPRGHALVAPNLAPSEAKKGHRSCLACARARDHIRSRPGMDLQATADAYHARILSSS